jgi:hypothetical protein
MTWSSSEQQKSRTQKNAQLRNVEMYQNSPYVRHKFIWSS